LLGRAFRVAGVALAFNIKLKDAIWLVRLTKSNPHDTNEALDRADTIITGHGVEAIQGRWVNSYYGNIVGLYVNKGDTYALTVLFDTPRHKFYITDLGTWVEENQIRYQIT
jgi:hypothetical protein